jgi:uncharacterized protein with NAD-binding domain and iron-sulfur cluster
MKKKVVILGGGVAGMSAAHELVERGFEVEVFEMKDLPGGKARSLPVASFSRQSRPPLPGEHGFRFFPGFYKHVVDTMKRIPFGARSVADNLVDTTQVQIARYNRPSVFVPARFPMVPGELQSAIQFLVGLLAGQLDVNPAESGYLATKVWQLLTSCQERRMTEYERISWFDYIEAKDRSMPYQLLFGHGITRSLVAAKARRASTKTIGNIFAQILLDILKPGISTDRLLNGPTNEVWLHPWLTYLRARGVTYHLDAEVKAITLDGDRVGSATITQRGRTFLARGGLFLSALPVERMAALVTPALASADPALAVLPELARSVEWMNGIQFYLTRDVPLVHGHTIYLSSSWALTSVSQAQFWPNFDLSQYGDGNVRGIISVDISNWQTPGLNGKKADACSRDEIRREVWEQLKLSVNGGGKEVLRDEDLHLAFLDPDIVDSNPDIPGFETNLEPLLVNYTDTWRLRPEATTRLSNFFLASDYVRTHTDLATMEAANEAARRAVNGILIAAGSREAPCGVWPLEEPPVLLPMQAYDRQRFRMGLPWAEPVGDVAQRALAVATYNPPPVDDPLGSTGTPLTEEYGTPSHAEKGFDVAVPER